MGATVIASWGEWLRTWAEKGRVADIHDPLRDELLGHALDSDPATFVDMESVFGSLSGNTVFMREYIDACIRVRSMLHVS
jgi:hypothetical protein